MNWSLNDGEPTRQRTRPRLLVLCKCGTRALLVHTERGPVCAACWLGKDAVEWLAGATLRQAKEDWGA